ncbi:MAG: hypothetical protein EA342_09985 [Leptolyngbya sp. LCM1.Bin17]|nr:MAG: hypothetical protein EA342_09985 [Leptolyngbya sp. LCM1.Bin17]
MTQAQPKLQTFADFLAYDDGSEGYYELTNGELRKVPPESYDNLRRALTLYEAFKTFISAEQGVPRGWPWKCPVSPEIDTQA